MVPRELLNKARLSLQGDENGQILSEHIDAIEDMLFKIYDSDIVRGCCFCDAFMFGSEVQHRTGCILSSTACNHLRDAQAIISGHEFDFNEKNKP